MSKQQDLIMPHCDARILHAPGECVYCDELPDLQMARMWWGINFTGHHEKDKLTCPAELSRDKKVIDRWYGNVAKNKKQYKKEEVMRKLLIS